ncbi:YrhK family protein [Pontibacillus salicampi]|uniref:YrhK family protein n=1 Tax=Pontibacillus salicampi TaxID=1449801 RepID=A0ABV6LKQ3_9BACI
MEHVRHQQADAAHHNKEEYVDIKIGNHDLFFKKTYEILYTLNDVLIGIWFLVGSICFYFTEPIKTWGVSLFVLGSVQLLIRPTIRLIHRTHLKRLYKQEYEYKKTRELHTYK